MPAPNRRNVGASLNQQIGSKTASRALDDRDNLVAARTRHAKKFEEVSASLERATGSDLERRAAQAREDYERAKQFEHFDTDVRTGKAKPPIVVLAPVVPARYYLGECLRCSREMWVHTAKPRVPICAGCRR